MIKFVIVKPMIDNCNFLGVWKNFIHLKKKTLQKTKQGNKIQHNKKKEKENIHIYITMYNYNYRVHSIINVYYMLYYSIT